MIKILLTTLLSVVATLLVLGALQPDTFHYARTMYVSAAPSAVFAQLDNPKLAEAWSPWVELDPDAAYTYEGPDSGVGASVAWDGDHNVGAGKMTVSESRPSQYVKYDMEFIRPMAGLATVDYTLVPDGEGTKVIWSMYGDNNYMGKVMSLLMNCEKMVGDITEKGFANMNALLAK